MARQIVGPLMERGFFWDDIQEVLIVKPAWTSAAALSESVETGLMGGVIDGTVAATARLGEQVRRLQSGYLRSYAMVFAAAVALGLLAVGVALR
jgi:NADH:ubiquinone oxidoreductase subunit 5 (subunit L)/multisubunit Na+/H+ antiporter MnhA subunit